MNCPICKEPMEVDHLEGFEDEYTCTNPDCGKTEPINGYDPDDHLEWRHDNGQW